MGCIIKTKGYATTWGFPTIPGKAFSRHVQSFCGESTKKSSMILKVFETGHQCMRSLQEQALQPFQLYLSQCWMLFLRWLPGCTCSIPEFSKSLPRPHSYTYCVLAWKTNEKQHPSQRGGQAEGSGTGVIFACELWSAFAGILESWTAPWKHLEQGRIIRLKYTYSKVFCICHSLIVSPSFSILQKSWLSKDQIRAEAWLSSCPRMGQRLQDDATASLS